LGSFDVPAARLCHQMTWQRRICVVVFLLLLPLLLFIIAVIALPPFKYASATALLFSDVWLSDNSGAISVGDVLVAIETVAVKVQRAKCGVRVRMLCGRCLYRLPYRCCHYHNHNYNDNLNHHYVHNHHLYLHHHHNQDMPLESIKSMMIGPRGAFCF
jgi:hypothetical protein